MKRYLALLLALVMLLSLAACGGQEPAQDDPEPDTTEVTETTETAEPVAEADAGERILRVGSTENSQSFSPVDNGSLPMQLAYETLTRYNADGSISMMLAESVQWVDDLTLQIVIRDDVYFSNGEKLSGEDVIYSLEYIATTPGSLLSDKFSAIDFDACYVEEDGFTVNIVLSTPVSVLADWLPKVYITCEKEASQLASDDPSWWDAPISTSAYEIVENVDGSHVTFALREDYWNKDNMPQWDKIIFNYFSNATAMFIAFENQELDIVYKADTNDFQRALDGDVNNPEATATSTVRTNNPFCMVLSGYTEEFDDPKVREAIAHAVDAEALALVSYGDLCITGLDSIITPTFSSYEAQGTMEYDLEYAKQCMAESGYPNGFELHMLANATDAAICEVLQAQLAEIGITLSVETLDFVTWISRAMVEGASDIGFFGGAMSAYTPYDVLSSYSGDNSNAGSRVLEPEFNEFFNQIVSTTDADALDEIYRELQRCIYEDNRVLVLFEPIYSVVYNDQIMECNLFDTSGDYIQYSCVPKG